MAEDHGPRRLDGGNMAPVHRVGANVIREAGEWTPAVHRLLHHLIAAGVPGVPKPFGTQPTGQETLSFIEGQVPSYPMPAWAWSETALTSAARLLRLIHDATEGIHLPGPWRSPTHEPAEVICHNDFATYNLVFQGEHVVGAIDWDFASPGPRLWDLAYLAYRMVPLSTADWADGFDGAERKARLRLLLDAYGSDASPDELIDVLRQRLRELAEFSDRAADRLSRPDLSEDALLYRRDAAQLTSG